MTNPITTDTLAPVARLKRDIRLASANISLDEARFLVDTYYQMQGDRIRDDQQGRELEKAGEPGTVISYLARQHAVLEAEIRKTLDVFSAAQPIGVWMRSITGIGPVIAAGMIAHIDIERCETASQIWRFAGLDPTVRWEKGQKRPWNARLKVLAWKLGDSFVKTSAHEKSVYGPIYAARKIYEQGRDARGDNAALAADVLAGKGPKRPPDKKTDAYKHLKDGHLPPAQLHARAKRYAVKMFLSHLHTEWRAQRGLPVREPYPIAHLGHAHIVPGPRPAPPKAPKETKARGRKKA